MVFVPCLSQDMDPISDMSYSNQAVPVESRILDVPERPVTLFYAAICARICAPFPKLLDGALRPRGNNYYPVGAGHHPKVLGKARKS